MIENWMKDHLISGINCDFVYIQCLILFYFLKKREILLALNLVLVTLHMQCTISIEKDK